MDHWGQSREGEYGIQLFGVRGNEMGEMGIGKGQTSDEVHPMIKTRVANESFLKLRASRRFDLIK